MDNERQWERDVADDVVAYDEALARLYELRDRYSAGSAVSIAGSAAQRHLAEHGHRLAFGCCRDEATLMYDLRREQERLLRILTAEAGEDADDDGTAPRQPLRGPAQPL